MTPVRLDPRPAEGEVTMAALKYAPAMISVAIFSVMISAGIGFAGQGWYMMLPPLVS
jgi:hypothetical protein